MRKRVVVVAVRMAPVCGEPEPASEAVEVARDVALVAAIVAGAAALLVVSVAAGALLAAYS